MQLQRTRRLHSRERKKANDNKKVFIVGQLTIRFTPLLEATIGGKTIPLLADSGASVSIISGNWVNKLGDGVKCARKRLKEPIKLMTFPGNIQKLRRSCCSPRIRNFRRAPATSKRRMYGTTRQVTRRMGELMGRYESARILSSSSGSGSSSKIYSICTKISSGAS